MNVKELMIVVTAHPRQRHDGDNHGPSQYRASQSRPTRLSELLALYGLIFCKKHKNNFKKRVIDKGKIEVDGKVHEIENALAEKVLVNGTE
jgi:hypothetical protein